MRNICISPRIYQSRPITSMTPYHIHSICPTSHVSCHPTTRRPPIHRSKSPYSDCNTRSFVLTPIKSAKSSGMRSFVPSHHIYDPYHIHPICPIVHVSLQPTTHRRPIHRSTEITRYAVMFQSLSGALTISRRLVYSIAFRMRES